MSRRIWTALAVVLTLAVAGAAVVAIVLLGTSRGSPQGTATGTTPESSGGTPPSSAPGTSKGPQQLSHQVKLGTYTDLAGQSSTEASMHKREAAMGRRYDLQVTYYNWNDVFPDAGEEAIVAHGRTVAMTWYGPGKDDSDHRTLAEVNSGADDGLILRQAAAIKAFGHRIDLRLMPEMNGTWYRGFSGNPAAYVAAWQRIHRLFAQAGADNVTWIWCPNYGPGDWDRYYPGDKYVDVIGVDGFSNTKYGWKTFEQMFGTFLAHYAGRKPLMVNETATDSGAGYPAGGIGSAADYISGMHSYVKEIAGPRYGLIGLTWFDSNATDQHDWRVDQTSQSWQAWLDLARDPYFGGRGG